ncbi:hypothetical protein CBR_g25884 [Chara braunii]|uniref:Uncharacterized protein n=1 Tax=Chara braunii TaxID=69332 RepID=A0A388L6P7_CHABU|nr:hypothetical protein CBR_g25884 [Chara braunii]|eukprot:GBG77954.1 hypothetical protein CBR_g25884 [Chara braunii]
MLVWSYTMLWMVGNWFQGIWGTESNLKKYAHRGTGRTVSSVSALIAGLAVAFAMFDLRGDLISSPQDLRGVVHEGTIPVLFGDQGREFTMFLYLELYSGMSLYVAYVAICAAPNDSAAIRARRTVSSVSALIAGLAVAFAMFDLRGDLLSNTEDLFGDVREGTSNSCSCWRPRTGIYDVSVFRVWEQEDLVFGVDRTEPCTRPLAVKTKSGWKRYLRYLRTCRSASVETTLSGIGESPSALFQQAAGQPECGLERDASCRGGRSEITDMLSTLWHDETVVGIAAMLHASSLHVNAMLARSLLNLYSRIELELQHAGVNMLLSLLISWSSERRVLLGMAVDNPDMFRDENGSFDSLCNVAASTD